jgi:hypothetical protein
MTELSPEARRLLGLARRGDDPFDADRQRMDQRMVRRFAAAATVVAAGLGTTKAASGAAGMSVLLGKGVIAAVVVTATTIGVWKATEHFVMQRCSAPVALAIPAATVPMAPRQPLASYGANSAPSIEQPAAAVDVNPVSEALADRAVTTANQPKKPQPRAEQKSERHEASGSPSAITPDPLPAEVAALREAQRAMTTGDPKRTLALVAEQNVRFAGGALTQERAAARIFALCDLGRVAEARSEAISFERRWPKSPLISRVRRACEAGAQR